MDTIKTCQTIRRLEKGEFAMKSTIGIRRSALLIALIFLIADVSAAASYNVGTDEASSCNDSAPVYGSPSLIDGLPPLLCDEELCDRPLRIDLRNNQPASEKSRLVVGLWAGFRLERYG